MKHSALITGASSGIGAATALELSQMGYFVYLAGRDEARLSAVAEQCANGASVLKMDFENNLSIEKYATHLFERPDSHLKILVNNAGIFSRQTFEKENPAQIQKMFQVNLFSPMLLTQKLIPLLRKNGGGSIVNVSSTLGLRTSPTTGAYSASKAAMISWTQTLALELAADSIRVNCICPGIVETPIHGFDKMSESERKATRESLKNLQPLGRIGTAQEIAHSICFLATEKSAWTTGSVLSVDGGIGLQ